MELTVTALDDGTYGLEVDGVPYTDDDDARTPLTRESVLEVINDARTIFGGNADSITIPVPPVEPEVLSPVDSAGNIILENFDPAVESPGPAPPEEAEPTPEATEPQADPSPSTP